MAEANPTLVEVLRSTADRLESGAPYQWTHQGRCNCGHLAQTITGLGAAEIHRRGIQRPGEWSEHANDYCPISHHAIDQVIHALREIGFTTDDLPHIEYLSDPKVLSALPPGKKYLQKNVRDDVIVYFRTWANQLEADIDQTLDPEVEEAHLPTSSHVMEAVASC
ncbi:MAG: hypothetical protein AAF558_11895 [Verrucomicrobiota bacterium]